ncbi:cellulose synthase operon protein YhjQ/BcsQ [Escherichia coli]
MTAALAPVITNVGRKMSRWSMPARTTCCACHFNVDFTHRQGWARAMLDGGDWRDARLRYTSQLDLLPFGQLSIEEQENPQHWQTRLSDICSGLQQLKASGRYQWIFNRLTA